MPCRNIIIHHVIKREGSPIRLQKKWKVQVDDPTTIARLDHLIGSLACFAHGDIVAGQQNSGALGDLFEIASDAGVCKEAVPEGPFTVRYFRYSNGEFVLSVRIFEE